MQLQQDGVSESSLSEHIDVFENKTNRVAVETLHNENVALSHQIQSCFGQ